MTVPQTVLETLRTSIRQRTAAVAVIGLGYVGLPLARTVHDAGYPVIGFDTDDLKIQALRDGKSYIHHVPEDVTQQLAASSRFLPTSTFTDVAQCRILIICLPTPVGPHNEPDMSFVESAARKVARTMPRGSLVILESTTYPGATDTDLAAILGTSGHKLGVDYFVAYSPEREDPANPNFQTSSIPKLVGGVEEVSGDLARLFYSRAGFVKAVLVSSARVAECSKLLENIYRAVNIALVNELKVVFRAMDVDIWEVLDAASTKPFGYQRFNPGPGIGGHCIPVDPFYLAWKARECGGTPCNFIELAAQVNARVPQQVVHRVQLGLNDDGRPVRGARVLLLGVAYKPNVDDMRCAPALEVWQGLRALGADVSYHDPYIAVIGQTRKHAVLAGVRRVEFTVNALRRAAYSAVVVLTNHDCYGSFAALDGYAGLVVDTRNCVKPRIGLRIVSA